jgi:hypothetical protein
MSDSQVQKLFIFRRLHKFLAGHNGEGPYARTIQLCIIVVVVVMRTFPNTWRRNHVNTKQRKYHIGQRRVSQYGMMLIVMKYNKKTGKHKCSKQTTGNPAGN